MEKLKRIVEAIIFISPEPVSSEQIAKKLSLEIEEIEKVIEKLKEDYKSRGIILKSVAGGYRFFTAPDLASYVKPFVEDKPVKLSKPLLEVLAIIAYNQPITKKEIWQIRGHNSDGAIKSLLEKGLIQVVGRASAPGRPKLYGTTDTFLAHFGLNSLQDLPKIEIEELNEQN